MKRLLIFVSLLFTLNVSHAEARSIIVEVKNPQIITKIKQQIPGLQIDHLYDTLFHGFSAEADQQITARLEKMDGVVRISRNVAYKVSLDESVPFIGGDAVRHAFGQEYESLTGEGIKVGVIDTGVDYTHPDLKKNYQGGYDVVDSDNNPMETKANQGEPTLHGTHVAGIIGADGKVKGVAPNAEIYGYRALGPGGVGTSEQVISAIEKAVEDGMDVINLSLGNSVNGPDWPTSIALNKAVEKGVVAVTSNGNSGPNLWTVGSPGTAAKAISVAASSPPIEIPFISVGLEKQHIAIHPMQGSISWEKRFLAHDYPVVDAGLGYPKEVKKAKDKIALIQRGKITFTEKALNAEKAGAKAVLIYNNKKGVFSGALETQLNIPVYSISKAGGEFIKKQLEEGETWVETSMKEIKDKIAAFSSRGPVTHTWAIKPDVSAPGVEIDSTIPGGYMALQGTSMSSPHVAGAAALVLEAHPNWTPQQVKAALMNTSKRLTDAKGNLYLPFEQGAGRIQVKEAVEAETLIYPSSLAFGQFDQQKLRKQKTITLTFDNQSNKSQKITFNYPKYKHGIQWEIPQSFTLKPGQKRKAKLTMDIQPQVVGKGIHQGYVTVYSNNKPIHLPYIYVIEEPDYPRVMGFDFKVGENKSTYKYEFYLPEGAEEVGVALYDPSTLQYKGLLFYSENVKRGVFEKTVPKEQIGFPEGIYKAVVYAKKSGKEETIKTNILIGEKEKFLGKNGSPLITK